MVLIKQQACLIDTAAMLSGNASKPDRGQTPAACYGSYLGHVARVGPRVTGLQVGDLIAGLGAAASRLVTLADRCIRVPDGSSEVPGPSRAVWGLAATVIQGIRATVQLGDIVGILGNGIAGSVTSRLARMAGAESVRTLCPGDQSPAGRVDVLIDTTGDMGAVGTWLTTVRARGRVALLAPTYPDHAALDFYADVHSRSIALVWCNGPGGGSFPERLANPARLIGFLSHLQSRQLLDLSPVLESLTIAEVPCDGVVSIQHPAGGLLLEWA